MNAKRRIAKLTPGQSNPHWWVGSDAPSDVSFIAQTASHVSESVATSEFLSANGVSARIFLPTRPRGFTKQLRRSFHRAIEAESRLATTGNRHGDDRISIDRIVGSSEKIVVFNDWGMPRDLVCLANSRGVETFGWVEGFQDFNNVDIRRDILPYTQVRKVLGLVPSEAQFFKESHFLLVGSHRLTSFQNARVPSDERSLDVLVNLNFTYGTSRRYARDWARRVGHACRTANRDAFFSRHALDKARRGYRYPSLGPLGDVICEAHTLVTRSGSALLEGLAAGCEVIFFNPNRERAANYLTSEFPAIREVTADSELAEALACRPGDFTTPTVGNTFSSSDPGQKFFEVIQDRS